MLTAPAAEGAAANAAARLLRLGYQAGDRLAVTTPEYADLPDVPRAQADVVAVLWGALRLGVIPVLIHPLLTRHEREFIISDARVRGDMITPQEVGAMTRPWGRPLPELPTIPLARAMHYTSGTSGTPKGVIAHLNAREASDWWLDEMQHWEFDRWDITLVHSPICHSAPLRFALGTLQAGGSVAFMGRFTTAAASAAITEIRPTTAFVVPSQLGMLMAAGPPPSPYRLLAHAGSACPPPLKESVHEWAGADRTWEFYGSTEGQFTSCRGTEWEERRGTIGRARPGRTLSTDDQDQVWCAAPGFARFEYWGDPDKTAAAWRTTPAGPAFTVGDLGRLDDAGYLYLEGRREDLIISGGVNVYPAEVEGVLDEHPGVSDVAVFPADDPRWGQRVVCAVVTDATTGELAEWARTRLAPYKMPKQWVVVPELPRNSMGKIRRTMLARELGIEDPGSVGTAR